MEFVDVVNEQGEVLGQVSKQDAHTRGLLHRTVIAEVIGSDGRWTLVRQSSDRQDAGQLVSPVGGHVTSGETVESAMKREANEELGLTGDFRMREIGRHIFNREILGRKENHLFILYEIYSDQTPVLNEESVDFVRLLPQEISAGIKATPEKFGASFIFVLKSFYPELLM